MTAFRHNRVDSDPTYVLRGHPGGDPYTPALNFQLQIERVVNNSRVIGRNVRPAPQQFRGLRPGAPNDLSVVEQGAIERMAYARRYGR